MRKRFSTVETVLGHSSSSRETRRRRTLVLIREERGEQKPIFYISKTLLDAESRYPLMEKLAYAVVTSARKLRPNFQSHTIVILTTFPLTDDFAQPKSVRPSSKMGSRVKRVRYRIPTENKCEIPSTRRLFSRTTNGNRDKQGTKFDLAPSRRRILIQARIGHRNPPHVSDQ